MVLRLSLHAVYYGKNETSERSLYIFLDTRPFGSLQALKLCFCLEDPQDQKKGQPCIAYVVEFIFSSERPKINPSWYYKKRGGRGQVEELSELSELFTVLLHF